MRHFVYFSKNARTSGNFNVNELMKAGRMDIVIHVIINAFFLSHRLRDNVKLHLVFYGMPDPPKHIEMQVNSNLEISKKDVAGLIKKNSLQVQRGKKDRSFSRMFRGEKELFEGS